MEEKLYERLAKVASFLHWIGKYDEANAVILACRLMRGEMIEKLDQWEEFVERLEVAQ